MVESKMKKTCIIILFLLVYKAKKSEEIMNQIIYEIDEEKLSKANPDDVICFLSSTDSMNGEAFLTFFNYFSQQLEKGGLTQHQQVSIAQYLYDIQVNCQKDNVSKTLPFNDNLPLIARCVGRKLILRTYLPNKESLKQKAL